MIERLTKREPRERYLQVSDLIDDLSLARAQFAGVATPPQPGRPAEFCLAVGTTKNYIDSQYLAALQPDGLAFDARCVVPAELAGMVTEAQQASALAIVDPVNYYDQSPPTLRPTYYQRLPYEDQAIQITGAFADDAARTNYASPILEYQRNSGASVQVAPYFFAGQGGATWIDESLRMGAVTEAINNGLGVASDPPWVGLAIAESWLRAAGLSATLAQIAHHRPQTLYLLVATGQSSAQPLGDLEILLGIRAVIELMENLGGRVVLGRRYSSGILGLAMGAAGFTVGYHGTHQNFEPPPMIAGDDGRGGRGADWYYVPSLLNSVKIATRAGLVGSSAVFTPVDQYGIALFSSSPALAAIGATDQRVLLHQHNFYAMRAQAGQLAAVDQAGRLSLMRTWVSEAKAHYGALGHPWDPGEGGDFLNAWEDVL
jgi:hypothetical protein